MHPVIIHPGSIVTSRLRMFFKETELSLGTGFFYRLDGALYLITNWHNVTGRHPTTLRALCDRGGLPDRIKYTINRAGALTEWIEVDLPLYTDAAAAQPVQPVWFIHPDFQEQVDVIALPLTAPSGTEAHTINTVNTVPDLRLIVSGDVFVLGYPKGISGGGALPIWKRASFASEPGIDLADRPMMLVDTATREGMSGGPAIATASGGYTTETRNVVLGQDGARFVGVYSGRLGDDEIKAQLGIIWKATVIDPIIRGQVNGISSFLLAPR